VYLAMNSGRLAARTVDQVLRNGANPSRVVSRYERRVRDSMWFYWEMVENFYTHPFMELFLQPRQKFNLPAAVNAVLAGELEGGFAMRWRMRVFFWLVKLQSRWPIVPRLEVS
jgi:flavin-dependent dehydrogenase